MQRRCLELCAYRLATVLLLAFAAPAAAQDSTVKVIVDAARQDAVERLRDAGARHVARRGGLVIYDADAAAANAPGIVARPDFDSLRLRRGVVRTRGAGVPAKGRATRRLQLIQFVAPPIDSDLQALSARGARLVHYVPQNGYLVWTEDDRAAAALAAVTPDGTAVQFQADYEVEQALSPHLDRAAADAAPVDLNVQLYNAGAETQRDIASIERHARLLAPPRFALGERYINLRISIPGRAIALIAGLETVVNIEPHRPPRLYGETQSQILAGNLTASGAAPTGPGYLTWLGTLGFPTTPSAYPIVAVVDDGVDDGTTTPFNSEFYTFNDPNQPSRIVFAVTPPGAAGNNAHGPDGHGNINASIVAGYNSGFGPAVENLLGFNYGLGVAPYGRIGNVRVFTPTFDAGDGTGSMVEDYHARGARISSNSWGSDGPGVYDITAQEYDGLSRDARPGLAGNHEILFIFAAGNEGPFPTSIGSPATAKNVLSIGASETYAVDAGAGSGCGDTLADGDDARDIAGFSSRGPCADGRIKPDIVAPGTFVHGAASQPNFTGAGVCGAAGNDFTAPGADALFPPGSAYTWSSGTSVSTPAVSGYAALLVNLLARVYDVTDPSPALLKAYIIHGTRYLTGASAGDDLPSPSQGYGAADMAVGFKLDATRLLHDQHVILGSAGDSITFTGTVPDPTKPVRIVLAWSDAPGTAIGDAFVNDLNLSVDVAGTVYNGNNFIGSQSQPGGTPDFSNNVEAVFLPPGSAGTASITIEALSIAGDGVPGNTDPTDQDFALVAYNFTDVTAAGSVTLDRASYRCSDTLKVTLRDIDLLGDITAALTLTTAAGDTEMVVASEAPPGSGIFSTTVATAAGLIAAQNGTIETVHGDLITVTYSDADDGSGNPAVVDDTAAVDCVAPAVSNVTVPAVGGSFATVSLQTDETASLVVRYGTTCGDLSGALPGSAIGSVHQATITGLDALTDYYFAVEVTDTAGNVTLDDNGGDCFVFSTLEPADYFTQLFGSAAFDLDNRALTLTPDGSANFYSACISSATSLPTDPGGGNVLDLADDGSQRIYLSGGSQVWLYGVGYTSLYVNSNGHLTFDVVDSDFSPSIPDHFRAPRVAALFDDLDPGSGGVISWRRLSDRIAVTFMGVPQFSQGDSNTFQVELFFDGTIRLTYVGIDSNDALVGVSAGLDVPIEFVESNLDGYGTCSPSAGRVLLDAPIYTCVDTLAITVEDVDLAGTGAASAEITGTGGDSETTSLLESPTGSGIFVGSLPTSSAPVATDDGVLQITSGQVVSATYTDADDGSGNPATRVISARTLCTDHFMLYKAKVSRDGPNFHKFGPLTLADDLGESAYQIVRPAALALAADKNGEGINDGNTHLQEYRLKAAAGAPRFAKVSDIRVISQCGDLHVQAVRPISLLAPAHVDAAMPVPPPDAGDHALDHFLCYRAKQLRKLTDGTRVDGLAKGTQAQVSDGFQTRNYDLKRVTKLCLPVDKSGTPTYLAGPDKGLPKVVEPSPIGNPDDRLVCYKATLAKDVIPQAGCGPLDDDEGIEIEPPQEKHAQLDSVHVSDQLGSGERDTVREIELCVPSLRSP